MNNLLKPIGLCFLILSGSFYSCEQIEMPTLTTNEVIGVTTTSAICGGNIVFDGGALVTERGVCWSINDNPTINDSKTSDGTGEGNYTSNMNNLDGGTTYYVRAFATNSVGTGYGDEVSFTTPQLITFNPSLFYGTVSDVDGNSYKTIQIGTQTWFAENLKTTKLSDNTLIPLVTDSATWRNLNTPAFCWYNNDADKYKPTYGGIYNWYAVNTGKLCPDGWHVPSQAEVTTLIDYLGGMDVAGGKLKETGTDHWEGPNAGASNSSGFTALPAFERVMHGQFYSSLTGAVFWTSTMYTGTPSPIAAYAFSIGEDFAKVSVGSNHKFGFSVRCLKD